MSGQNSGEDTNKYGTKENNNKSKNADEWKTFGHPEDATNKQSKNFPVGRSPDSDATQWPCGCAKGKFYGKTHLDIDYKCNGNHSVTTNDGAQASHVGGPQKSSNKGSQTANGQETDQQTQRIARLNAGKDKQGHGSGAKQVGGGGYSGYGSSGYCEASGKGAEGASGAGHATYSDGSIVSASPGNYKSAAGKKWSAVAGDTGGKGSQTILADGESSQMTFSSEPSQGGMGMSSAGAAAAGGCCISFKVKNGDFVIGISGSGRQAQLTMGKDGSMSMSGKGDMSFSTTGEMNFAASSYSWQPGPGAPRTDKPPDKTTSYGKEKAFSDGKYEAAQNSKTAPVSAFPICPLGQHWDTTLMRCVVDDDKICPPGQHWDFSLNKCVLDPNQLPSITNPLIQNTLVSDDDQTRLLIQEIEQQPVQQQQPPPVQQQSPVQQQQIEQQELQQRIQQIESTILDDRIRLLIQQQMQIANQFQVANTEHS